MSKNLCVSRAQTQYKNENCVCLVVFIIKFTGFVVHDSAFKTYSCITYEFIKLSKLLGAK